MADPQPHDETKDNASQHPATRRLDRAVLGTTPQTARLRTTLFILLFIVIGGTVFYFLQQPGGPS